MNKITFSMTYYGQVDRLQYQLDFFDKLPAKTKQDVSLQIVNDGYNDGGVFESLLELYKDRLDLKGYKITADIGFNSHGARNLLMMESETHWNMLMDIDVYMEPTMVTAMVRNPLKEENIYVFKVAFDHPDDPEDYDHVDPKKILKFISHPNTWLITKPAFWSGGGYDIEFTGMRHGDAEFFLSLDRDKYDHVVFHPDDKVEHEVHVRNPNRNRSYLNQATEHVKNLGRTVDFVKKRNEDKDRKHKKRLICFPWKRVL
jgi:hypothetical protein